MVIPACNEQDTIAWTYRALCDGLSTAVDVGLVQRCEVVVVDDHSTDRTAAVLAELVAEPGAIIRRVPNGGPQGLGAAIRAGLAAAEGDLALYTDADLPFDPVEIPRLVGTLDRYQADMLCGYRLDRTVEGTRRGVQSHAFNLLVRALLPVRVRDVNFACKLLRRSALDAVLPELSSDGPFIDAELVARASHHSLRVVQVGVDYFPRFGGTSTLGGLGATVAIAREAIALQGELRRRP